MDRKFYVASVGQPGEDYVEYNWERCVNYNCHVMHKETSQKGVFDDVKENSICFLKYNNKLIAYGEVEGKSTNPELVLWEDKNWCYVIKVKEWIFFDKTNKRNGVKKDGIDKATIKGSQMATIKEVSPDYGLQKMKEIDSNSDLYKKVLLELNTKNNMDKLLNSLKELLEANKNLILTGAPGTGKTYLAKEIAKTMIGAQTDDDLEKSDQFGFVQFHPSYDYTDFVEGLRPTKPDENGNIGFELKNGIFKEFCEKASESDYSKIANNFNSAWDKLITSIRNNIAIGKLTKIGSWDYGLSSKDSLKYSSVDTPSQYTFTITKKNVYDVYQGKQARPAGGYQNDMNDIVDYMKQHFGLVEFEKSQQTSNDGIKNFVFVIDEINRGEISKIFGELFFSIDPGYRGEIGSVKTQYSNLHDDINEMFYVPENVYIIGTMNDIDRSVESFDFAMRRRFVWREITAEESQQMFDNESWKKEASNRMNNLNTAIENIEGLNSSYHIGAAYFKNNLPKYNDGEKWDKLWELHLKPLLSEYLRGMSDQKEKLESLKTAYDSHEDN